MLVQVRWGHGDTIGRSGGFRHLRRPEFGGDDHIAPNGKRIVPDMLRHFKIFPFDELRASPSTLIIEDMYSSQCQRLLRHVADETELTAPSLTWRHCRRDEDKARCNLWPPTCCRWVVANVPAWPPMVNGMAAMYFPVGFAMVRE